MNLICKINGKVYDKNIAQGLTISEEYNETLDSGAIILTHVNQIVDLKPYDDVWIYEKPEKSITGQFDYVTIKNEEANDKTGKKRFYRHFLVDNYSEKILNLEEGIYEYTIELFSETKLLEKIICPSTCVTEPLDIKDKHDIVWYLKKYIELYSPEIKRAKEDGTWEYQKKYSLSENLVGSEDGKVVGKVQGKYPQDFQLTNPTLREILTQLLLTQDLIPIVKDDVIDALDITQRIGAFHNNNIDEIKEYVNSITGSMSSDNYTDSLRKTYTEAISQECLSSNIERIGFRNKDSALLTLSNLQIETRFPIYSIEQAYLCYYKRLKLEESNDKILYQDVLCKQDITPFILLNSARNVLSKDWSDFLTENPESLSIDEITKYRMYTLGYDIGSNIINGWGERYSYASKNVDLTLTYIQNIIYYLERRNPFGINLSEQISNLLKTYKFVTFDKIVSEKNPFNVIPDIWFEPKEAGSDVLEWTTDVGTKIKSMFVELKYKGFFKGTVITSKDGGRDYIQTSDNSNSSLTLLEKDGLSQKEKINRFGNKTMVFTARYPGNGYNLVQPLGCVYNYDEDRDIVIYHKEMAFYDNAITCTYYGARDYVLKNFYTSVRAKLRLNRLMSYEESVRRCENTKVEILFSKEQLYYNGDLKSDIFSYINSAFNRTPKRSIDYYNNSVYDINKEGYKGAIEYKGGMFLTDLNKSINGKSIIFNLAMYDNVSTGVYIDKIKPPFNDSALNIRKLYDDYRKANPGDPMTVGMYKAVSNYTDYTGSTQKWYLVADKNGESSNIYFYIGKQKSGFIEDITSEAKSDQKALNKETRENYEKSFKLPKLTGSFNFDRVWGVHISKKDNKEIIDQTFQIEYCTDEKDDVFIGQNYLMLNELINNNKVLEEEKKEEKYNKYILSNLFSGVLRNNPISGKGGAVPYFELVLGNIKDIQKLQLQGETIIKENVSIQNIILGEKELTGKDGDGFRSHAKYTIVEEGNYKNPSIFFNGEVDLFNNGSNIIKQEIKIHRIDIEGIIKKVELSFPEGGGIVYPLVELYMPCKFYYRYSSKSLATGNYQTGLYYANREIKISLNVSKEIDYNGIESLLLKNDFENDSSITNFYLYSNIKLSTSNGSDFYVGIDADCFDLQNQTLQNEGKFDSAAITKFNFSIYEQDKLNLAPIVSEYYLNLLDKEVEGVLYLSQTMFVVYSPNPCTKTTEYEQYGTVGEMNGKKYYIKEALKVSDVFVVENNKIIVKKPDLINKKVDDETILYNIDKKLTETLGKDIKIKSIQYWYYDNSTHSYKFVFGINLTENTTEESVYFSVVKNKDTRVFDKNGEVVGHIHNFAGEEKPVLDENGEVIGEEEPDFAQKFD